MMCGRQKSAPDAPGPDFSRVIDPLTKFGVTFFPKNTSEKNL